MTDLFDVKTSKSIDKNKLTFDENGEFDFVGRSNVNNGIQGRVNKLSYEPNPKETFSLVQVGESVCLYRDNAWYASQNIFVLTPLDFQLSKTHRFVSSSVSKALWQYRDAYTYPTLDDVKALKIQLPVNQNKIDFDFMESFIAELEAERVAELSAYLKAGGFDNYELSAEELDVLQKYKNNGICLKEFSFSSIFNNIKQGRRLKKEDQLPGEIPFVMSGVTNTGVIGYISNPVAMFNKNSITVDIFGNSFYRNYDFGAGDDTGVYWNTEVDYSKLTMLYFTATIQKALEGKFSYGKKLRSSQSYGFTMKLPSKDGKPDFKTMDTLISAIQKLVIKDVVKYSNEKIKAAESIVLR